VSHVEGGNLRAVHHEAPCLGVPLEGIAFLNGNVLKPEAPELRCNVVRGFDPRFGSRAAGTEARDVFDETEDLLVGRHRGTTAVAVVGSTPASNEHGGCCQKDERISGAKYAQLCIGMTHTVSIHIGDVSRPAGPPGTCFAWPVFSARGWAVSGDARGVAGRPYGCFPPMAERRCGICRGSRPVKSSARSQGPWFETRRALDRSCLQGEQECLCSHIADVIFQHNSCYVLTACRKPLCERLGSLPERSAATPRDAFSTDAPTKSAQSFT